MYDYLRLWILGSKSTQGELNNKVEFIIRRQEYVTRAGMHQEPWKGSGKTGKLSPPFCFLAAPTPGSFSRCSRVPVLACCWWAAWFQIQIFSWRNLIMLIGLSIHDLHNCVIEIELSEFRTVFREDAHYNVLLNILFRGIYPYFYYQ